MASRRTAGWQRPALIAIAVAGIAISVYLTATHVSAVPLVCTIGSVVNCASVTHSAYSVIPGTSIPISFLGIVWFAVSAVLAVVPTNVFAPQLAAEGQGGGLRIVQFLWSALGLVVVLYLVFVEIVILHQVCEWCSVVHLLVISTFVITVRQLQRQYPEGSSALPWRRK